MPGRQRSHGCPGLCALGLEASVGPVQILNSYTGAVMPYPEFFRVTQTFPREKVEYVPARVKELFAGFSPGPKVKPGQSVAICVGSRGTHDLKDLVIASVECLKEKGLKPHLIPAMGSHGGATGEGQAQVIRDLGITEQATGCAIRASMDVTSLGRIEAGAEVFLAKDAQAFDHVFVINRVKPHTIFRSHVESGLCKMLAVGLGRQVGASNMHKYDLAKTIIPAARLIMQHISVIGGLSVTENAYGDTHSICLVGPDEFEDCDARMLNRAWTVFPRLPMEELDLLIVDMMGKDISGAGMDPNVVGFWRRWGGPREPDYNRLAVLDLSEASHGNAQGMGLADVTTKAFMDKVDIKASYTNAITSTNLVAARIPMTLEHDKELMDTIMGLTPDVESFKAARIIDTSKLSTFWVTRAVLPDIQGLPGIEVKPDPISMSFGPDNRLAGFAD
jgi:hypothetical protein